jgi:hypothetical protein
VLETLIKGANSDSGESSLQGNPVAEQKLAEGQGKGDWQQQTDLSTLFGGSGSALPQGLTAKYQQLMPSVSLSHVKSPQFTNEREVNPQVELSSNKERGTEQECADLLKTIRNLIRKIKIRIGQLAENIHNLPETHPDDDRNPRLSRRGHRRLINMDKAKLAENKVLYQRLCGQLPEDVRESDDPRNNWFRLPDWAVEAGASIVEGVLVIPRTLAKGTIIALQLLAALLGMTWRWAT